MDKGLVWTAKCQYPDKKEFSFFSPTFVVDSWSDLEQVGAQIAAEAWAKISPHEPPTIISYDAGYIGFVPTRKE